MAHCARRQQRQEARALAAADKEQSSSQTYQEHNNLTDRHRALVNVMRKKHFDELNPRPTLQPTNTKIFTYGAANPIPLEGVFKCSISYEGTMCHIKFFVATRGLETLLSSSTSEELRLTQFEAAIQSRSVDEVLA